MLTDKVLDNPYFLLPIQGGGADTFLGSKLLVRFILESISSYPVPRSIELVGLPGMGKSTILKYVANPASAILNHKEWLQNPYQTAPWRLFPVYVEFHKAHKAKHPFVYLREQFCDSYRDYRKQIRKVYGDQIPNSFVKELIPTLDPALDAERARSETEDESISPEQWRSQGAVAASALQSYIRQLGWNAIRPVLFLDDFDQAFESLTYNETTLMRPWREEVAFVLATERSLHTVNPDAAGSPFFFNLIQLFAGRLSSVEAEVVLKSPLSNSDISFPDADRQFILSEANGHIYLLLLGGKALWETRDELGLLKVPKSPLEGKSLDILRGRIEEEYRGVFQLYWQRLDGSERQALQDLIASREGNGNAKPDYRLLSSLSNRGLVNIEARTQEYVPFSPLFTAFLKEESERDQQTPARRASFTFTGREKLLYDHLRNHRDELCTFEALWREVWHESVPLDGDEWEQDKRTIQVSVSRLRSKLTNSAEDITSLRGQGYRLVVSQG